MTIHPTTDPIALIIEDRELARSQQDPYADACFLVIASQQGEPSVGTLVLRDIRGRGFGILFNATSPKWQVLAASPEDRPHDRRVYIGNEKGWTEQVLNP